MEQVEQKSRLNVFTILEFFMPLVVLVTMVLEEYVSVGAEIQFGIKDITKLIITIVCLICVYLPLKDAFVSVLNTSDVTTDRKDKYADAINTIHEKRDVNNLAKFCAYEHHERKERVIDAILENTGYTYKTFKEKYQFDKKLVLGDKALEKTPAARHDMLKAIKEEKRIKAETIDTILPCGNHANEYRRIKSNSKKTNAFVTSKKMITVIASSFMLVSVTVGMSPDATPIAVATRVMISLTLIIMNSIGAFFAAKAINKVYNAELFEKTAFVDEFLHWKAKHIDIIED